MVEILDAEKTVLRKKMIHVRDRAASIHGSFIVSMKKNVQSILSLYENSIVAGYYPKRCEINILPFLLGYSGCRVALPLVDEDHLEFVLLTDQLVQGSFGIPIPSRGFEKIVPDILFVPGLAFTRTGDRLGYGKGHFDRVLNQMILANKNFKAFGVCYDEQVLEALPIEPHDMKLHGLMMPSEIIDFSL